MLLGIRAFKRGWVRLLETKIIEFCGDRLSAAKDEGAVFVPAKQVCEALGLSWPAQFRKLQADEVLNEGVAFRAIPHFGEQTTMMIRSDLIPLWLTTITASRVKEELRQKLTRYRREAARVLAEAFIAQPAVPLTASQILLQQVQNLVDLERRQADLEAKVDELTVHRRADFISVVGFARKHRYPLNAKQASRIGKLCTAKSRAAGIEPPKVDSEVWGEINIYPGAIVAEVFKAVYAEPLRLV